MSPQPPLRPLEGEDVMQKNWIKATTHLSGLVGIGSLAAFGMAQAETAPPQAVDTVEQVVVTANRTLDRPIHQIKRDTVAIVDGTTALAVEKTPDDNLAQVLDRVVGVSSDKFTQTSEAGSVSIRGFDARYNSMAIDGNPILFTSQNNRGAQLAIFPASIVKETLVYKSATPDMDANTVGGHIALRTLRAFDGGTKPYVSLGLRLGVNDNSSARGISKLTDRLYGAGKFTFGDQNQYGVVLGFDRQANRSYDAYGAVDGYNLVKDQDVPNGNVYSNSQYQKFLRRHALYGKFETRAIDRLYAFVSLNLFKERINQYLNRAGTYIYSKTATPSPDPLYGQFTGGVGQTKQYDYDIRRDVQILGGGFDYRLGAHDVLSFRANATAYDYTVRLRYPEVFQLSGLSGNYDLSGDFPRLDIASAAYADPTKWAYRNTSASYIQDQILNDKVYSIDLKYEHNIHARSVGLGYAVGGNLRYLDRTYDQQQLNYKLPNGTKLFLSDVFGKTGMANHAAVFSDWNGFWDLIRTKGTASLDTSDTADYRLKEQIGSAFATLAYGGETYRITGGLRLEHTRVEDRTSDLVKDKVTPLAWSKTYSNLLPSLNAYWDIQPSLRLKAAYSQTIGRPDFADFAPGRSVTLDVNGNPVIKGTNRDLGPRKVNNYDLSADYYLKDGFLSAAIFFKDLKDETFTQQIITKSATGDVLLTEQKPLNTGSAKVLGYEFSAQKADLKLLPPALGSLGAQVSYSRFDGQWDVTLSDGTGRSVSGLRNQPRWLGNLSLTHTRDSLETTLSYRLRGKTFTGTFGADARGDRWIDGYEQLDLHTNYKLNPNFTVFAEARNLTNDAWTITTGPANAPYQTIKAGRSYYAGIKYRY